MILDSSACATLCVGFSSKSKVINISQNIFWNQKHVTNQGKQGRNCLSKEWCKELFEQRSVKVFDQN